MQSVNLTKEARQDIERGGRQKVALEEFEAQRAQAAREGRQREGYQDASAHHDACHGASADTPPPSVLPALGSSLVPVVRGYTFDPKRDHVQSFVPKSAHNPHTPPHPPNPPRHFWRPSLKAAKKKGAHKKGANKKGAKKKAATNRRGETVTTNTSICLLSVVRKVACSRASSSRTVGRLLASTSSVPQTRTS